MNSKPVVFSFLLFLSVLDVASAVSEAKTNQDENSQVGEANPIEESKQRCDHGCCRWYRCLSCCPRPSTEAEAVTNSSGVEDEKYPIEESKQRCRYGCCRFANGRCYRCCPRPPATQPNLEADQQESEVETTGHEGGGGGGK